MRASLFQNSNWSIYVELIKDGNLVILYLNKSDGDIHKTNLRCLRTLKTNYSQQLLLSSIKPNAFVLLLHYSIISYFYYY